MEKLHFRVRGVAVVFASLAVIVGSYVALLPVVRAAAPPPFYTIVANANTGGSITPSGSVSVQRNHDQSFSIVPDPSYVVSDILVDGSSVGKVNEYTFGHVTAGHAITASFDGGWKAPSANTNEGFDFPAQAYTSDNTRTSANSRDDIVQYSDFSLDIPSGAIIQGIEVSVEGYTSSTRQADVSLSWDGGASWSSVKTTTMPVGSANEATIILGGASDAWDRAWNDSEFSNTNFRVMLDATSVGVGPILYIDQLQVKVTYTSGKLDQTISFFENDTLPLSHMKVIRYLRYPMPA